MSYIYKTEVLKNLQLSLTEMLSTITFILNKNQIPYCLIAGTALGAKRHNGFIPWDDDIDIGVLENDMKKLQKLKKEFEKNDFFLACQETERNNPYFFTKIRKNNTVFEEYFVTGLKIHKGIFIDIFPLREVSENRIKYKLEYYRFKLLDALLCAQVTIKSKSNTRMALKIIFKTIGFLYTKKKILKLMQVSEKNSESSLIGYLGFKNLYFKKKNFLNATKVRFEDLEVLQMKNVEEYLFHYYGKKCMDLPNEEDRINHEPVRLEL